MFFLGMINSVTPLCGDSKEVYSDNFTVSYFFFTSKVLWRQHRKLSDCKLSIVVYWCSSTGCCLILAPLVSGNALSSKQNMSLLKI